MINLFDSHISAVTLALLMGTGFCAAFIDSIAGGGGLLTVPAFLTAGVPPHITLGTNKLAATMGVSAAVWAYLRKGFFKPHLWVAAIMATLLGSIIGAISIHFLSAKFLQLLLPALVILVAIYALWPQSYIIKRCNPIDYRPSPKKSALIGSVIGFYDGFFGPGTGAFWTSSVMFFFKLDILAASAVARFMNFVSNLVALITFCALGNVNYTLGFSVGVAMIAGAYLGSQSAIKYGAGFIKPFFIVMVVLLAARLIYLEWL